ncbi:unnamed protein product [Candida verbasci]|uniref:Uncharacterized protein n=1 Tax=Candida verbasci TaxID=1227364 RepID=A0A9W4TV53_9ASCO|nr:unnamed protein product [Candida verbasci]
MSQYIGKTISLISNKGLRYVGLLENINADDATVALKTVRLFGSEGRMAEIGQPHLEVPPGNEIYDYVVFRGSDVKDLNVLDTPIEEVKPIIYHQQSTAGFYQGPTQNYQQPPPQQFKQPPYQKSYQPPVTTQQSPRESIPQAAPASAPSISQPVETGAPKPPTPQPINESIPKPTPTTKEPPTQTTAEKPPQPEPRSEPNPKSSRKSSKIEIPNEEFNFEEANAKFSKELEQEKELEQKGYNKSSSFFDTLSSSTEERSNMRWSEEKSLNMDTFGESSLHKRGGYRGRGRGRGRGGRGNSYRGRGRGRGRSNDYNSKPEWA